VLVTTDDTASAAVAREAGAGVIERRADRARADSPIDDAVRHAVADWRRTNNATVDIVVSMQANTPVRRDGEIDAVVARLQALPGATAVATATRLSERVHWAKSVVNPETLEVRPLVDVSSFRVQDLPPVYLLDGAIIAVRTPVLEAAAGNRRVHAYLGEHLVVFEHDERYATEIDERADVAVAESILTPHS
jgi:N-acylneuraminate cytidylyltransferase